MMCKRRSSRWLIPAVILALLFSAISPVLAHEDEELHIYNALSLSRPKVVWQAPDAAEEEVTSASVDRHQPKTVDIQILNVSDWHAQLDPLAVTGVGNVGGAAVLSTYFQNDRANNPNTLTLTGGDAFGAAPPLSGFFNEEPAIRAMRLMGFDADTLGNHNFDRDLTHLQSMVNLAADTSGTVAGQPFAYVSANLKNLEGNLSGVAPYKVFTVGGVKVAVIGLTNPEAPTLVTPSNFGTIQITDLAQATEKARKAAKKEGAKAFIVICHLGVTSFDSAGAPLGPLVDYANAVEDIDLILGDHTDVQYSGIIGDALVVENRSKGLTYARSVLSIKLSNGKVQAKSSEFVTPLSSAVVADPALVSLLAPYRTQLAAALDGTIGVANAIFPRGGTPSIERSGESALGNLIADGIRARYGVQMVLINGGGIRSTLPASYVPLNTALRRPNPGFLAGPPFDLVIGDVYTIQPFGNVIVTRNVTGAQLWAALENGVSQINPTTGAGADGRFPQISGFRFTFNYTNPAGSRVLSVALNDGTPVLRDATTYTLATTNFINGGGDSYTMFVDGQGVTREVDAQVMLDSIRAAGPVTPVLDGRITKVTVGAASLDNAAPSEAALVNRLYIPLLKR